MEEQYENVSSYFGQNAEEMNILQHPSYKLRQTAGAEKLSYINFFMILESRLSMKERSLTCIIQGSYLLSLYFSHECQKLISNDRRLSKQCQVISTFQRRYNSRRPLKDEHF